MQADERRVRDDLVLRMFLAGSSYRQIARRVGLKSHQTVGDVITRELRLRGGVSGVVTPTGQALFIERSERLLQANWPAAMEGDHAATRVCLGVLADQARFYGLV